MSDGGIHTVTLVEYDPAWATQFESLRRVLATALGERIVAMEHVGSTSIPGMVAKAVLDIDIVIDSIARLPEVGAVLSGFGYQYVGERGVPGRESFKREGSDVPRDGSGQEWPRHHLYVCPQEGRELPRHLAFRDYLRAHPKSAAEYAALKRELAARFAEDVDAYCDAKAEFVEAVISKATRA